MSKKAKPAVIAVAEPEVQNNINMNLTHNDIIDVAIQTQLELLEPRAEELVKMIASVDEQIKETHNQIITRATERANFCKEATAFNKALVLISGNTVVTPEIIDKYSIGDSEQICSAKFPVYHRGDPEEYKNPIRQFKTYTDLVEARETISRGIRFRLKALVNGLKLTMENECRIDFTEKEYITYKEKITKLLDQTAKLNTEWYETRKQILELKYDEKKIKARVVKMSLTHTKQGKQILSLLEKSTKIKLLS